MTHRLLLSALKYPGVSLLRKDTALVTHDGAREIGHLVDKTPKLRDVLYLCMNRAETKRLEDLGCRAETILPGAPKAHHGQTDWLDRPYDCVTVARYYPRKNPELFHNIVKVFPGRVLLVADDWETYEGYRGLVALPNLTVVPLVSGAVPYALDRARVVLSPSMLEGGPMPLIEGLLAGTSFVASSTGFAPDLQELTGVGAVLDTSAPPREWVDAIVHENSIGAPAIGEVLQFLEMNAFLARIAHAWLGT